MRTFAEYGELSETVRKALGTGRVVAGVERLPAGSKKGVYRVRLDGSGPRSVIVYRWADEENFWPGGNVDDPSDPFAAASGLAPYLAARRALEEAGARMPELLSADGAGVRGPVETAVVEDIRGGTLERLLTADPERAASVLADLARTLDLMRGRTAPRFGRVDLVERGGAARAESCEQRVFDRALGDLAEAAGRDPRIAAVRDRLDALLRESRGRVVPRARYGLAHGELGPDHVLVDDEGRAVLIDIDNLMYFDSEWEHVFLRIRFGPHYAALAVPGLDPRRTELYMLAMRLSLVAGPLRLLDGDFPDRAFMRGIVEHNLAEALALLP
ncbi:phosphotransferase [Actinacidiphila yeochonensis]|uniref:phosphotransferase n=1 Tax=Actinacidiphila yeochonensis TaxID=89050 RepID=UPI0005634DD6|nr:phosphotransferase [Actinacidiphila yeochonensis]